MRRNVADKPAKPYPDFPLTAHPNGQWCKKIRVLDGDDKGKSFVRFFGRWSDPVAALNRYLAERDDLRAGKTPGRLSDERATTDEMIQRFLARTEGRVQSGEISRRSLDDYIAVGKLMASHFGKSTDPTKLKPADFAAFRTKLAEGYGPARVSKTITVTRMVFKWAFESELIDAMPRFGPDFSLPSAKQRRIHKAATGKKLLTADEAKALASIRDPLWRSICLLGLNGGLGNTDIAELRVDELSGDWLGKPRGKTGVDRRIPLWPETVAALAEWMAVRPAPAAGNESLVFVSVRGGKLIRINPETGVKTDMIGPGFKDAREAAGVDREGIGFYWLRHTFQTIGDGARDTVATSFIMGHVDASISGNYREGIEDERLLAVTNHVRKWLLLTTS